MKQYTIYNSAENGWLTDNYPNMEGEKVLKVIHNAGFFSCCSIRLLDIIIYFNEHLGLPEAVDSSTQFAHYKVNPLDNLIPFYFDEQDFNIPYEGRRELTYAKEEPQFSDYRKIAFNDVAPFMRKYFEPSQHVQDIVSFYETKYKLEYENLCAVFYRGNDKSRETAIAPYDAFIDKARDIKDKNPNVKFLVQPDETEFLVAFNKAFPDSIFFYETPSMEKKDSVMFEELPRAERGEFGAKFFAAVLCLAKCEHLITHSGNCGFWAVLYREGINNVHQILNNEWL